MSDSPAAARRAFLVGLIERAVVEYERGEASLGKLVADVEAVIDALADVADGGWVEELRSAWSGLEIVNAILLHEGRPTLSFAEQADMRATVAELRSLLDAPP